MKNLFLEYRGRRIYHNESAGHYWAEDKRPWVKRPKALYGKTQADLKRKIRERDGKGGGSHGE